MFKSLRRSFKLKKAIKLLKSPGADVEKRKVAVASLVEMADSETSFNLLIPALEDQNNEEELRIIVARALAKTEDIYSRLKVPALRNALNGPELLAEAAVDALATSPDSLAFYYLVEALTGHRSDNVRKAAAKALGQLGNREAVEPLVACIAETSDALRKEAATALFKLGETQWIQVISGGNRYLALVAAIEATASPVVQIKAAKQLGTMRNAQSVPILAKLLTSQDSGVRATARSGSSRAAYRSSNR